MTCEEALELLSGHLDGETTPEEEALLQAHLGGCPSCREVLGAYEEMQQGLTALEAEPPAELHQRIMEAVRSQPAARRSRAHLWRTGGTIAAAAVVALVLLAGGRTWFFAGQADPSPAPVAETATEVLTSRAVPEDAEADTDETEIVAESQPETEAAAKEAAPETVSEAAAESAEQTPALYAAAPAPADQESTVQTPAFDAAGTSALTPEEDLVQTPAVNTATVSGDEATISEDSATILEDETTGLESPDNGLATDPAEIIPDNSIPTTPDNAVPLVAVLTDDPLQPAAVTIAELSRMTVEEAEDGSGMQYWSDVATVRAILAGYADRYVITAPDGLDQAADTAPCAILVLQP